MKKNGCGVSGKCSLNSESRILKIIVKTEEEVGLVASARICTKILKIVF